LGNPVFFPVGKCNDRICLDYLGIRADESGNVGGAYVFCRILARSGGDSMSLGFINAAIGIAGIAGGLLVTFGALRESLRVCRYRLFLRESGLLF